MHSWKRGFNWITYDIMDCWNSLNSLAGVISAQIYVQLIESHSYSTSRSAAVAASEPRPDDKKSQKNEQHELEELNLLRNKTKAIYHISNMYEYISNCRDIFVHLKFK